MHLHLIDRATARSFGLRYYFTGKPCSRGNCAERRVSSAKCLCPECIAAQIASDSKSHERARSWREANPERQKEHERKWREKNRDHETQRLRQFYIDNPEKPREYRLRSEERHPGKYLARKRLYYRNNPHKARIYVTRRRAAKLMRTPTWLTPEHNAAIEAIYAEAALRRKSGENVHVDHIIPLVGKLVSGLHVPWNLAIIPAHENQTKNNRFEP